MESRIDKILHLIDKSDKGLEIGPSYNPVTPKAEGWNVEIVDHLEATELRKKYAAWSVDTSAIEEVDYVIGVEGLFSAVGSTSKYDYIIASHVIEHSADIITFLGDCEKLLKDGGVLSLVIPDKRYCFDILKPLSTTGQVLQAHLERRKRHTPGTIFDAHALHAMRGDAIAYPGNGSLDGLSFAHSVIEAKQIMDNYALHDDYMDVHAWYFTPNSFQLIISDLINLRLLKFEVASFFETVGFEFFMMLRKSEAPKCSSNRVELARQALQEELESKKL